MLRAMVGVRGAGGGEFRGNDSALVRGAFSSARLGEPVGILIEERDVCAEGRLVVLYCFMNLPSLDLLNF